ncbi:MAG: signal recognition particle-docking protein FtsY [Propionibacteriaceae bacterium]|nr:signal recognition particle-docking protein FtsY [Propionibacteriaceae bacterium]
MDVVFWYILGGIVVCLVAASVVVVVSNRKARGELVGSQSTALDPGDEQSTTSQDSPGESSSTSRMARLRTKLASSHNALARGLAGLLSSSKISDQTWEEFEATLLSSDLGVGPTTELIESLKNRLGLEGVSEGEQAAQILREEMINLVNPALDRDLHLDTQTPPAVILMVGVNGTGKTTTAGKLAKNLQESGSSVLLGAADTFRAAAADQLTTWGERIGAETVRGAEGADPASVAFDAVRTAQDTGVDVAIIDTAGRLHNKANLMDELGKVKRVIEKVAPVCEVLLVLDATTGQNGLAQARVFAEVVEVTGIVLTKLDGSAKGGIVIAVQQELAVPVKYIGLGEGADDLAEFSPELFVDGLLGL